jgi:hypothetical protein
VKTVHVRLVIMNLADVAMCGSSLPAMEVSDKPGHGVFSALRDVIHGSRIINWASPKLVGVYDAADGGVDIVWRVRTTSMALSENMRWVNVNVVLNGNTNKHSYIAHALSSERT